MTDEGFEEWDADFLDQLIQVEEKALSSTVPTQHRPQQPPHSAAPYDAISYSPPRVLSQRVQDKTKGFDQSINGIGHSAASSVAHVRRSQNVKETEIDRLKRELGRVSKQLTDLEQECSELKKERDKKEDQLKSVFSHIEAKDAEDHCTKSKNLESDPILNHPEVSPRCRNAYLSNDQSCSQINLCASTSKAVGVQTDKTGECTHLTIKNDLSAPSHCPSKLLAAWDAPTGQRLGRNLVSKLFVTCETDFHVLFGCPSLSLSSKTTMDYLVDKISYKVASQEHVQPAHSLEAAKVSHLYSMLMKVSNEMVRWEALVEALVDLCGLENVIIVYRSLRVLHMVLKHFFSWERLSCRRDNVVIEGPASGKNTADKSECAEIGCLFCANASKKSDSVHIPFETRLFNAEILCEGHRNLGIRPSTPCIDWVSLFELMHLIAMRNNKEHVRLEAVTIMNMILMRGDAYLEREKFGRVLVFQNLSQLLRKEAGLRVQKQAVHLLYLLLNCPKLMARFCSGFKEEGECARTADNDAKNSSAFQGFSGILEGLADCLTSIGNGMQELTLKKNAVSLLAFLVSSGKSGFEILLGHRLPKRTNFLALILQMLILEMDVETSESAQPPEIFKERTLLIREALILLNRLVSSPQYSTPVLRVLTNSRDITSLTSDIANRLSRKGKWLWQSDSMTRQMRESEIVDLARVFKRRVFSFLGDVIS